MPQNRSTSPAPPRSASNTPDPKEGKNKEKGTEKERGKEGKDEKEVSRSRSSSRSGASPTPELRKRVGKNEKKQAEGACHSGRLPYVVL